jgi:hypothetical protein
MLVYLYVNQNLGILALTAETGGFSPSGGVEYNPVSACALGAIERDVGTLQQ